MDDIENLLALFCAQPKELSVYKEMSLHKMFVLFVL